MELPKTLDASNECRQRLYMYKKLILDIADLVIDAGLSVEKSCNALEEAKSIVKQTPVNPVCKQGLVEHLQTVVSLDEEEKSRW